MGTDNSFHQGETAYFADLRG